MVRRSGAGRALIAACENLARSRNIAVMQIGVLPGNARAHGIYRRQGGLRHPPSEIFALSHAPLAKVLTVRCNDLWPSQVLPSIRGGTHESLSHLVRSQARHKGCRVRA